LPKFIGRFRDGGTGGLDTGTSGHEQFGSRAALEDGIINNLPGTFVATFSLSRAADWASITRRLSPDINYREIMG
jgi:hypothetical protein